MDAITICAVNYLPFAEVLGNSFLEHNSESTFSILVIDAEVVNFHQDLKFRYLTPRDLDISKNQFENMAFYYNVTELATALKPTALKTLFKLGSKKVIYLDPDIQVFGKFTELDAALNSNGIVLTPHTLNPIPRDGLRPSEADIMASGTFNLGFLGLSDCQAAHEMLNWWETRLEFDSISDPSEMLFTDQRWIDLVPSYFDHFVLREPNYNVAYWNLQERQLSKKENGGFEINGKDLRFFHFSGYRPEKPWILSKYVSDNPRIVISKDNVLAELCNDYGELAVSNGWKSEQTVDYGYSNFPSGKQIPSSLRRLYREECIKAHKKGETLTPPENWQTWATQRSVSSGNLSRILFSLWKSRPDLMRRYPDATGTEARSLQDWARTHGVSEKVIDADLLEIGNLIEDKYPVEYSKGKGINVAGYLNGEFGLGQSARLVYQSAQLTGLPTSPLVSNRATSRNQEVINNSEVAKIYPLIISVINADHFQFWIDDIGPDQLKKSRVIGLWAWETEDFPARMHEAFKFVDEIWAVSEFVKTAIQKHTKKQVFVFPTPILAPNHIEKLDRNVVNLETDEKYNLFIFDYASVFNRKNPLGLVVAHKQAFPNQDGPTLLIKSTNGDKDSENREKLRFEIKDRSDIKLYEDYLSRNQLTALINECEAYISLHRSEGYGLTMAEAMSLGKPVIATEYSGNLDFMNVSNSILIPIKEIQIGSGSKPYLENSIWADPDLTKASEAMKKLHFSPDYSSDLGRNAKSYVEGTFTLENASRFIRSRADYHGSIYSKIKRGKFKIVIYLQRLKKSIRFVARNLLKILKNG